MAHFGVGNDGIRSCLLPIRNSGFLFPPLCALCANNIAEITILPPELLPTSVARSHQVSNSCRTRVREGRKAAGSGTRIFRVRFLSSSVIFLPVPWGRNRDQPSRQHFLSCYRSCCFCSETDWRFAVLIVFAGHRPPQTRNPWLAHWRGCSTCRFWPRRKYFLRYPG